MNFEPKYSDYKWKVEESFKKQQFMELIKAELIDVRPGYCEILIPFDPTLTQQHGYFHAGVVSTIADNTAGYASLSVR